MQEHGIGWTCPRCGGTPCEENGKPVCGTCRVPMEDWAAWRRQGQKAPTKAKQPVQVQAQAPQSGVEAIAAGLAATVVAEQGQRPGVQRIPEVEARPVKQGAHARRV